MRTPGKIGGRGDLRRICCAPGWKTIECIAMDTKDLARATHDTVVAHVAEERETKAAIDELILLWRAASWWCLDSRS